MNKEEILEKSRQENKNQDIFEKDAIIRAGGVATKAGLLLCCLIAVLEVCLTGSVSFGTWTIYFGILCTTFFTKYHILHRRHELMVAVLYLMFGLCFLSLYIIRLVR
ncbi:DUF6442 family protein [Anaerolentibacter hominis]|uniref:DUF6442 family protein n=1 Tax=Anaerolentibacter hominis TaxID=3079009 RepID=UPI0031B8A6F9